MLPQWRFALEGRVNPSGLVVLYMATTAETAISEIRPWVGDIVSVVHIEVMKGRRVVEPSKLHSEHQRLSWKGLMARMPNAEMAPEEVNEIVWSDIEYAFSRPVTRSETGGEYAPTQILAGAVRVAGFDGVAYKSLFGGDNGYNVAFFGTKEVRLLSGHLYQVKDIEIKAEESGGSWVRAQESLHSGHT